MGFVLSHAINDFYPFPFLRESHFRHSDVMVHNSCIFHLFFLKATTCFHLLFIYTVLLFVLQCHWCLFFIQVLFRTLPVKCCIRVQYIYSLLTRNNCTLGNDKCSFRFPPQLRSMCHCLYQVLSKRFPLFPQNSIGAVGTVIFLRFINPAIGKINYIIKLTIF
jgi:hypothetical protein